MFNPFNEKPKHIFFNKNGDKIKSFNTYWDDLLGLKHKSLRGFMKMNLFNNKMLGVGRKPPSVLNGILLRALPMSSLDN